MPEDKILTGYPSIDKPWLKYYSKEAINAPLPQMTMYEYVWENNKSRLDSIAIEYFGNRITYQSMFDSIEKAAKAFVAAGIQTGDVVVIASVTLPEIIYAIYALNRIGAIANMVDPRTSTEGIRDYIQEVAARLVLTIDVAYSKLLHAAEGTSVKDIVSLNAADSMPPLLRTAIKLKTSTGKMTDSASIRTNTWSRFIHAGRAASFKPAPYQPNSCSLIVHTGGTTGISKGVMISNDNANAGVHEAMHSPILMESGDVFLNIMPPFIAYGIVLGIHTPLSWGWKSVIIPKFDPASFGKLLVKHRPNGLIGVPSYFEGLFVNKKIAQMDLSFVKCVLAGGDKIPPDFEERINTFLREHYANIHLTKGYSLTEASAMATVSYENTVKIGSSGVPLVNTVISAFKEGTENELTYGKLGEICISSPTIMLGYCKNEEATKDMVRTHRDGNRWIHTGDLGYVDDDGFVFIEGRIKRMIIRYDGFKVFPPYIEKVVMAEPAVESCCAVAKPDVSHGQGNLPFVFCVLKPGVDKTQSQIKERLIALCRDKLPEYSQPIGFQFISELPVTPIGKVDYRALEAIAKEM